MPEYQADDAGSLWRSQTGEPIKLDSHEFIHRRTNELQNVNRSEVRMAIAAAAFFAAMMVWRFRGLDTVFPLIGTGLVLLWAAAVLWRSRRQAKRPSVSSYASSCLDHYRSQLEHRRDHLRSSWLWHGPLVLACIIAFGTLATDLFPSYKRILAASPLLVALVIWVAFTLVRRFRQAAAIQRELDEIVMLGRRAQS